MCDIAQFPSPRVGLALFLHGARFGHTDARITDISNDKVGHRAPYYVIPVSEIIPPAQGPIALFREMGNS